ncbi:MAG: histidine phosphatase family protein [Dehalococcoidia bacterium]
MTESADEADRAASRPPRFPTTRIWLVSVGELEDESYVPDFSGHSDPALSSRGKQQATATAEELALHGAPPVAAVYASPLASAQTAAALVAGSLGLEGFETAPALATVMPETLPPGRSGIETLAMIQDYAWSHVEVVKLLHEPDVSVVFVSHELPIRALVCKALSIPLEESDRFQVQPGSLSAIEFRGPRTILALLNDLCHLDA